MSIFIKISEIMSRNLKKIKVNQTIGEAHEMMNELKIHHLLVVDDNDKLIGVISDRDIKKILSPFIGSKYEGDKDKATLLVKIQGFISKKVLSCGPDDTVKTCIELMLQKSIHSMPVVNEEGKLIGIVTSTDILRMFLSLL